MIIRAVVMVRVGDVVVVAAVGGAVVVVEVEVATVGDGGDYFICIDGEICCRGGMQ